MADVLAVNGHDNHYHGMGEGDRSLLHDDLRTSEERMNELLRSDEFREEVEGIVQQQLEKGVLPPNLSTDSNNTKTDAPRYLKALRSVIPVSDIRGVDSLNYRKGEKVIRCKLASFYRLLDIYTRSEGPQSVVYDTYVSARNGPDELLISPRGLLYSEVTASSLIKINTSRSGAILDEGSTSLEACRDEVDLHTAVYSARNNINCVVHVATPSAVMVSVMKCGLLPLCYEAMVLGDNISYHDYSGSVDREEAEDIRQALGESSQIMFLRNFGVIVVGETIEEAYRITSNVMTSCDTQVSVISVGVENLFLPSKDTIQLAYTLERDLSSIVDPSRKWNYGDVEFEGLMRKLDNEGYCTGYTYRDAAAMQRSVSVADSTPGKTSVLEDRASGIATPLSLLLMRGRRPEVVVSPNFYEKKEDVVDSAINTGSLKGKHKKVYRWVSTEEGSSSLPKQRSASMKAISPNKFAPQGANPNELRQKVKEIRKEYFDDTITAGPQSTVLEGVTWEEARRIKEGQMINGVDNVRVTAASRGVIQREHQHDALFYKKYTLNNPFENVTEEELEKYKSEVARKSKKGTYGKYAESEPEFLSSEVRRQPVTPPPARATTPPAKPARMSPTPNDRQVSPPVSHHTQEAPLSAGSTKPVLAAQPQPRPALSTQNQSDNNVATKDKDFPKRSQSARYPNERRPDTSNRSALLDVPAGHSATLDNRSSKENSPVQDGSLSKEKKKKKGLRLPSFSKKKEKQ